MIRKQLFWGITLIHAVMMGFFVLDLGFRQKTFLIADAIAQAKELAHTIANNSISWVLANDVVGLQEIINSQKLKSNIMEVIVVNENHKVLAHTDESKLGKYIDTAGLENFIKQTEPFSSAESIENGILAVSPIKFNQKEIGKIFVNISLADKIIAIRQIYYDGLVYIILAVILGAILAWFMAKFLTQQIDALIALTSKVRAGDRGVRAKNIAKGELGFLASDINLMLDVLEKNENRLLDTQKNLREAKESAEVASKSKAEFLANMSHEIRTPLNAVVGFCEVLSDTSLTDEQNDYLQRIHHSGKILQNLIDDILEFSRIESAKMHIEKLPFQLELELNKLLQIHEIQLQQKKLGFHLDVAETVPKTLIGDSFRLIQILNNLLANAIKFTSAGEVELTVKLIEADLQHAKIEFRVTDTGIGIKREQIPLLFQSFSQADGSITKKYGGTGLGLIISQRLAHLMNGDIRIESEYGKGSSFILTIDFVLPAEGAMGGAREKTHTQSAVHDNALASRTGEGIKTVLVVDDNPINLQLTSLILKKAGIGSLLADSGEAAIRLAEQNGKNIHAILMDLQMPGLDGFETSVRIRNLNSMKNIPIIALSARAFESDREDCFKRGMNDHIAKPFDRKELISKLKKYLEVTI